MTGLGNNLLLCRLPFGKLVQGKILRLLLLAGVLALVTRLSIVLLYYRTTDRSLWAATDGTLREGIPASCLNDWTCKEIMSTYLKAQASVQTGGEFEDRCAYRTEHGRAIASLVPPPAERRIPKIVHFIFVLSDSRS